MNCARKWEEKFTGFLRGFVEATLCPSFPPRVRDLNLKVKTAGPHCLAERLHRLGEEGFDSKRSNGTGAARVVLWRTGLGPPSAAENPEVQSGQSRAKMGGSAEG